MSISGSATPATTTRALLRAWNDYSVLGSTGLSAPLWNYDAQVAMHWEPNLSVMGAPTPRSLSYTTTQQMH
jgi:hypothetical protein